MIRAAVARNLSSRLPSQHRTGRLIQTEEFDHVADVLREHPFVATRQDRHGPGAKTPQFRQTIGILKHVH